MPTPHEAVAAVPPNGGAGVNKDLVRGLLVGRTPYALLTDDPTDFTAIDPDTGDVPPAVLYNNTLFWYDAADTSSVHDGVTILVSIDGKRFKVETSDLVVDAVLSQGDTTPPGSPSLGDAYIIGAAATGAWSGQDNNIGLYTARGWVFLAARTGKPVYVEDITGYAHYNAAGAWETGLGASVLGAGSVAASNMVKGGAEMIWSVENQTTNTPPGSPATGICYIVGPSPTGAWAGQAAKLAQYLNSAWVITAPGQGWHAYDKALKEFRVYDTTDGWQRVNEGEIKVSTATITVSQAQVDIVLPTGFTGFRVELEGVSPTSGSATFRLRFSDDGGATFDTTNYYYENSGTLISAASSFRLEDSSSVTDTNRGIAGRVEIIAPFDTSLFTTIISSMVVWNTTSVLTHEQVGGARRNAVLTDALRFFFNTGNIAKGKFTLYGRI